MTELDRILERGRQEGRQEGREEGRQEGRQEARTIERRTFAEQLLTLRFGALTPADHALLDTLSAAQIDDIYARLVDPDFQPEGTSASFLSEWHSTP